MMTSHGGLLGSAVAFATAFALTACTGGDDGSRAQNSSGAGGETRAPVSPEAYRTALETAAGPLNSALTALGRAKAYKGLTARITAVAQAADQASAQLGQVRAPVAVAAEHVALVAAVRRLGGDLASLRSDVSGQKLCTAASARGVLGRGDGATAVRDATRALAAKAPDYRVAIGLPTAEPRRTRRLPNGRFVLPGDRGARGILTIDNGGGGDSVITLAKGERAVYSVYVRKGGEYTVTGVSDGTYRIFFTSGSDWDSGARAFSRDCAFERFEESLAFRTVRTSTRIRWSTWRISLQPVVGGTARTSEVGPEDYPGA